MSSFLDAFLGLTAGEDVLLRVIVAVLILVLGHIVVKLVSRAAREIWTGEGVTRKKANHRLETIDFVSYILDAVVILTALLYLNAGITTEITASFVSFLPDLITVFLVGILGFIAINLFAKGGSRFLKRMGAQSYLRELGLSGSTIDVTALIVKAFLYILLLQVALQQIGIGDTFLSEFVTASSWAIAFLGAALLFYGFKDLFRNLAAGIYLKNSRLVRPGEEIRMDDETGKVRGISLFSTTLNTDSGYTLLKPNTTIMDSDVKFKRTKNDIETLEEIKEYFVPTRGLSSAHAVLEAAMDIFGFRVSQSEIEEHMEELDDPEKFMNAVEELSGGKLMAGYIEKEKTTDIGDEFKAWFNEGALVLPVFERSEMFHQAEGSGMVLALGVEDDGILVVDPNSSQGGVYYIDKSEMVDAMKDDHGYYVLAPEATNARWRLEKGLLYSDKNYYDELSKTLETRLTKTMRQGRILSDVMPSSVRDYLEDWRSESYVSRLWRTEDKDETSESDGN